MMFSTILRIFYVPIRIYRRQTYYFRGCDPVAAVSGNWKITLRRSWDTGPAISHPYQPAVAVGK